MSEARQTRNLNKDSLMENNIPCLSARYKWPPKFISNATSLIVVRPIRKRANRQVSVIEF